MGAAFSADASPHPCSLVRGQLPARVTRPRVGSGADTHRVGPRQRQWPVVWCALRQIPMAAERHGTPGRRCRDSARERQAGTACCWSRVGPDLTGTTGSRTSASGDAGTDRSPEGSLYNYLFCSKKGFSLRHPFPFPRKSIYLYKQHTDLGHPVGQENRWNLRRARQPPSGTRRRPGRSDPTVKGGGGCSLPGDPTSVGLRVTQVQSSP